MPGIDELRFGVVFFNDTNMHEDGWAASYPDPARRVAGTQDLGTDTIWITNLQYDLIPRTGLDQHARFRRDTYLKEPTWRIAKSLGVKTPKKSVEVLSSIFDRTMRIASTFLGYESVPQESLRKGLRGLLGTHDPELPRPIVKAINDATSYYVNCERPAGRGTEYPETRTFRFFALDYTKQMLSHPVPRGRWEEIRPHQIPPVKTLKNWLTEQRRPLLAKIEIYEFDESLNNLTNFGSNAGTAGPSRCWVTTEELLWLLSMADLKVREVYKATSVDTMSELVDKLQSINADVDLSFSGEMFLQNLWTASHTKCSRYRPHRRVGEDLVSCNPFTPFVRALDRLHCFLAAYKLQALGFQILGYGASKVVVDATGKTEMDFAQAAVEMGMIPSVGNLEEGQIPAAWIKQIKQKNDSKLWLQLRYAVGDLDGIMEMDKRYAEDNRHECWRP